MTLQDAINKMGEIAKDLKVWFRELPEDKDYPSGTSPIGIRNGISLEIVLGIYFSKVLTCLRVNDQKEIARNIELDRDAYLSDLHAVQQAIYRGDNPPISIEQLRSKITYLIGTLEDTAKEFTATQAPLEEIDPKTRQQAWVEDALGYLTIAAVGTKTEGKITTRFGSKLRKAGNTVRWMTTGRITKIHERDTYEYLVLAHKPEDETVSEDFVAGVARTAGQIRHANNMKKWDPNPSD